MVCHLPESHKSYGATGTVVQCFLNITLEKQNQRGVVAETITLLYQ